MSSNSKLVLKNFKKSALVHFVFEFRTGLIMLMTDGIKRCWCMHSRMVCATVCFIPSGFGPVRNEKIVNEEKVWFVCVVCVRVCNCMCACVHVFLCLTSHSYRKCGRTRPRQHATPGSMKSGFPCYCTKYINTRQLTKSIWILAHLHSNVVHEWTTHRDMARSANGTSSNGHLDSWTLQLNSTFLK